MHNDSKHIDRISLCILLAVAWFGMDAHVACAVDFEKDVRPILQSHCIRCHGEEVAEANVRLDTLSTDLLNDRAATERWHEVLNALDAAEMPPEGEPQLSSEQLATLTTWVATAVQQSLDARRKTDGRAVIRRLNRIEYQNTMRDLLDFEMDYVVDLPPDAISADGFQNDARALQMSPLQLEYYLSTARRALDRVIVSGDKPNRFDHTFTETKIDTWLGDAQRSNRLGRQQEFLAKIVDAYPDDGDFYIRLEFEAELKPNVGFPLLEVSVGYQPDTEILLDSFPLVEITTGGKQTLEFRGRLENFPLPVRGQGKFPGLVVRIRNLYDDHSPKPEAQKDDKNQTVYPDEPTLPTLTIHSLEFHGNAYETWPPARHRAILFDPGDRDRESADYVREVLRRFMSRAFRRDAEENEVTKMFQFYESIRGEFPSFEEAIRETLAMVLIQPDFLYRLEPSGEEKRQVTDLELASRLSFFLWSTMPDQALLERAKSGQLREGQNLRAEVERMLDDPRASRLVEQFTDQWLSLNMIDNIAVNRDRYSGFDDALKSHMVGETRSLVGELLRENLSAMNLLKSDFTMLNEPLAKHYGVEGVHGLAFRRVSVSPEQHRGGLLGHASILLVNSTGADSHPIRRAVWIRDRLLNDPPAPPPPNVPSLEEADPEFHKLSIRKQLELHRTKESCNRCHRSLDPWGIALENYDAVGRWREGVEATDTLPGGHEVAGFAGLQNHLFEQKRDEFTRSLISRLLTYALGRSLELNDQAAVEKVALDAVEADYRMIDIVQAIVASEPFQTK